MLQVFHQPHPSLRDFVNNIMIFRMELDKNVPPPTFSFPPLPEQCLYFYPFGAPIAEYLNPNKQVKLNRSVLAGPQISRIRLHMNHANYTIKVGFQPGGLYRLLGIPMSEFPMDETLDSQYILDKEVNAIADQLAETGQVSRMIAIVEGFLLKKMQKLRTQLPIDRVLPELIRQGGLMNIDNVASLACVSTRQLERQFQQRVGIQPKFYARITRFAKAWVIKENSPNVTWTRIAHECGYFDQMHLIRDFKSFCGVSPRVIEEEFQAAPFLLRNQLQH